MAKRKEKTDETFYDKTIRRFKSSVPVALFLLLLIIYTGVTEVIKNTKENRDNLFGKEGLFKKQDSAIVAVAITDSVKKDSIHQDSVADRKRIPREKDIRIRVIRDTILVRKSDTVFIIDSVSKKDENYSFRLNNLREGQTFSDPLTGSSISIFDISDKFQAKAILDYPDGFYGLETDNPAVTVRPGDSWNNIFYDKRSFKMTILDIDHASKSFSVEIRQTR